MWAYKSIIDDLLVMIIPVFSFVQFKYLFGHVTENTQQQQQNINTCKVFGMSRVF